MSHLYLSPDGEWRTVHAWVSLGKTWIRGPVGIPREVEAWRVVVKPEGYVDGLWTESIHLGLCAAVHGGVYNLALLAQDDAFSVSMVTAAVRLELLRLNQGGE